MDFVSLIFYFFIIIPSAIIHEYAHGWVADRLGDPTARYAGRLTLDPRTHIDPIGTLLMPLGLFFLSGGNFLFAYAKPVPFNPYNLKSQKWGPAIVGVAGPLANLLLATTFALVYRLTTHLPIAEFLAIIVYANVLLAVFNLVPLPPLDGSKILFAVMPPSWYQLRVFLERYGFVIVMFFVFFLFKFLAPVITGITSLLLVGSF